MIIITWSQNYIINDWSGIHNLRDNRLSELIFSPNNKS